MPSKILLVDDDRKKKILYIEDTPDYAAMVTRTLEASRPDLKITVTESLQEIEKAITHGTFDLILSDFDLKGFDAREVLKKRNLLAPDLPFIIFSGVLPEETAVELLKMGADDYILKDQPARLPAAIDSAIKKHALDLPLKAAKREVEENAARFRQAQKMEAIGRLAGGIAHDFNNILGAIEGYATLTLNALKEGDPIKPDIEEIRKAVTRAAALTRQLLVFSRKTALQKKACSANAIIENLQSMVKRIIGEDVRLELELQPDLPTMLADAAQIEQLLVNLLVNARDAMPGGGNIKLRTLAKTMEPQAIKSPAVPGTSANFIVISVKDAGQGMSPETLEHIFEPFFTIKEKGKGAGLGLATVYGVVKQHNGWIEVTSSPGQGSEFIVYLPAAAPTPPPAAAGTAGR